MKILILAMARTGGQSLLRWLAKELDYNYLHEPPGDYIPNENEIVKILIFDKANIDFSLYDKIIGLTRLDDREVAISWIYTRETDSFHKPYIINEKWINERLFNIKSEMKKSKIYRELVLNSEEVELQITYEGIYYTKEDLEKLKTYLGISNFQYLEMINKSRRFRKNNDFL